MYTLEGLNEKDIKEIYASTVNYSIKKYDLLPETFKTFYKQKYLNAQTIMAELETSDNKTIEQLREFLETQKELVNEIRNNNQQVIDLLVPQVISIFKQDMPTNLTELEKYEYIFDFITNTINYSSDWLKYCHNVPPIDGFDFDFYHGIPTSNNYAGLLITKQGICEDIANLMIMLGKEIGVEIYKTNCDHNDNLHAINYILNNGKISYIDATSVILNNKNKEDAFLVSSFLLNKDNDYILRENMESETLEKGKPKYNINSTIDKINQLMPQVNYISINKLEK